MAVLLKSPALALRGIKSLQLAQAARQFSRWLWFQSQQKNHSLSRVTGVDTASGGSLPEIQATRGMRNNPPPQWENWGSPRA